jgi:hypothetical protein
MASSPYDLHPLSKFLRSRIATDPKTATMTCMAAGGGKWFISDEDYPEFYRLLHDYLFVKKNAPRAFVEHGAWRLEFSAARSAGDEVTAQVRISRRKETR